MRTVLLAACALAITAPASAQGWDAEFGIQGGYSRWKQAGTPIGAAEADVYGLPSATLLAQFPTALAAYAILPVGNKFAIEPGLSFLHQPSANAFGDFPYMAGVSLRADYAITPRFYGALGLYARYAAGSPGGGLVFPYAHVQPGVEGAVGYRLPLNDHLNGRLELQAVSAKNVTGSVPFDVYSLLFGVSAPLTERKGRKPSERSPGVWSAEFGFSAGVTNVHLIGGGDFSTLSFPSSGASASLALILAPAAPTLFAIFPLKDRWAFEVGADAFQIRIPFEVPSTMASFQIAPRVDMAVGQWYAALGPQFHFVRANPGPLEGVTGLSAAWGYRFHLSGALNARAELSYGVNAKRRPMAGEIGPTTPTSALGLNFGMLMPLK